MFVSRWHDEWWREEKEAKQEKEGRRKRRILWKRSRNRKKGGNINKLKWVRKTKQVEIQGQFN